MKIKQLLLLTATFLTACALLIFPGEAADGARNGIGYCLQILVPSLYPFMVLAVFLVKSGLSDRIGRLFETPARRLVKLPGSAATAVLMSMIGGYPTGARSIAALYDAGAVSGEQAARMLCFCVNSGPAFVISAVGVGFLRNRSAGYLLFASQLAASVLLSLLSGITAKKEPEPARKKAAAPRGAVPALIAAAADAARGMISMCCFVVLFAAILNLLRIWVRDPGWSAALSGFLEVTGGCSDFAKRGLPLWAVSLIIGWGGLCVHFQVLSSVEKIPVRLPRFFLFRLLHGGLAASITACLEGFFPESRAVFQNTSEALHGGVSASVPAATALIVLCAAFVLSLPGEKLEIPSQR